MRIFEFAIATVLIELTPGPNMSYLAALALADGRRAAATAVAGVALGISGVGILVAFGLAEFFDRYPLIETMLRWGGIAFMLFLSLEAWVNAGRNRKNPGKQNLHSFWKGFVTNMLNPKLILFYLVMVPDFVDDGAGNVLLQNLTLVAIYTGIATAVHLGIIAMAGRARASVLAHANQKMIGRSMSVLLFAIAAWMFAEIR